MEVVSLVAALVITTQMTPMKGSRLPMVSLLGMFRGRRGHLKQLLK